jgi:hypothetical protein
MMNAFSGVEIFVVDAGTVVGTDKNGVEHVVTESVAVVARGGRQIYMTAAMYAAIKTRAAKGAENDPTRTHRLGEFIAADVLK